MLVELDDEVVENIVIHELKDYFDTLENVSDSWYAKPEDRIKDRLCLDAIIIVLSHFMSHKDHELWLKYNTLEITQK